MKIPPMSEEEILYYITVHSYMLQVNRQVNIHKMKSYSLLVLFTSLQFARGEIPTLQLDTSNYELVVDSRGGNFSYFAAKCEGEVNLKSLLVLNKRMVFNFYCDTMSTDSEIQIRETNNVQSSLENRSVYQHCQDCIRFEFYIPRHLIIIKTI